MNSINFQLPELSKTKIKAQNEYLVPYRKQGIRLEHELINNKHVIHNYGHGSSGMDLAYGTAFIAVKAMMIKIDNNRAHEVAILGSGIIAVMTGIELIKRGFRVTLYSQEDFKLLNMNESTQKSAPMGYSLWFPDGYDYSEDLLKHELVSKFSYDYLQECLRYKRYRSVHETSVIQFNRSIDQLREVVSDLVFDNYRVVNLDYGNGQQQEVVQFNSIIIDNSLYYEQLKTQLILRGGKVQKAKFNDLNSVLALKQQIIFNCLGPHSKNIFADDKLLPRPLIQIDLELPRNQSSKSWHLRLHLENDQNYQIINRNGNLKVILPPKSSSEQNSQSYIQKHLFKIDSFFETRRSQRAKL